MDFRLGTSFIVEKEQQQQQQSNEQQVRLRRAKKRSRDEAHKAVEQKGRVLLLLAKIINFFQSTGSEGYWLVAAIIMKREKRKTASPSCLSVCLSYGDDLWGISAVSFYVDGYR